MIEFLDRHSRLIEIDLDATTARAYFQEQQVGYVSTTGIPEDDNVLVQAPAKITGWQVDAEFQRAGIATALVEALVVELGMLVPADFDNGIAEQNTLTADGVHLTRHCQSLGLIYDYPADQPDDDREY